MDSNDAPEFTARLIALAEVFDVKLSPARQALYFEALADLDAPDVFDGMAEALKSCKFFPKPVEIREFAHGTPAQAAEEAWLRLRALISERGAYREPDLENDDGTLYDSMISVFGSWRGACAAEFNSFVHKEFLDTYQRHAATSARWRREEARELPVWHEPRKLTS